MNIYKKYEPDNPEVSGALYLKNENGLDWYDAQRMYSDDTLKVSINEYGHVKSYSYDASALFPLDCAVIELEPKNVPLDLNSDEEWVIVNNDIVRRELTEDERIKANKVEMIRQLSIARDKIEVLSDAVEFNVATDIEMQQLTEWKRYRLALTRINISKVSDIEWPLIPQ